MPYSAQQLLDETAPSTPPRGGPRVQANPLAGILAQQGIRSEAPERKGFVGAAFGALEQLRRPQAGVFQAVIERARGGGALKSWKAGLKEVIDFEERPTFEDVLNAGGTPEFPFRGVVEFLGDVVIDPLWVIPIGKGVRVAGNVGRHGMSRLEATVPAIKQGADGLRRAFTGAATQAGKETFVWEARARRAVALASEDIEKVLRGREAAIRKIAQETGDSVDDIKRAVTAGVESKRAPYPKSSEAIDDLADYLGASEAKSLEDVIDTRRMAREILGNTYDPFLAAPKLSAEARELAEALVVDLRKKFEFILSRERGLLPKELRTAQLSSDRLDYITHSIHPDAKKILLGKSEFANVHAGYSWSPTHASMISRRLKNLSVSEANAKAMRGEFKFLNYQKVPLFIDDPAVLEAIRMYRHVKSIAAAKLLDDSIKRFGVKGRKALEEKVGIKAAAAEWDVLNIPGFKGWYLPKESAQIVQKHFDFATDASQLGKFRDTYQGVQNAWKVWTLGIFPEYHVRNGVTNVMNNYLAGMGPSKLHFYLKAGVLQSIRKKTDFSGRVVDRLLGKKGEHLLEKAKPKVTLLEGGKKPKVRLHVEDVPTLKRLRPKSKFGPKGLQDEIQVGPWRGTVRELLDDATEQGVFRGGVFGAELAREEAKLGRLKGAVGAAQKRGSEIARGEIGPVRAGFKVGQTIEDNARLAHYLWRLSKGDDAAAAGRSVKKSLFNYDELDPFTQSARWAFPFATWSRFNIPYQIEHLVMDPAKASIINKFRISIENEAQTNQNLDERFIGEYIRTGMGIRVKREGDGTYKVFLLDNWIPFADLAEVGLFQLEDGAEAMSKKAGKWVMGMLSPLLKIPAETVFGKSFFLDRDFLPEKRRFLGVNLSERQANILRSVRALSVLDRFLVSPRSPGLGAPLIRTLTGINLTEMDLQRGRKIAAGRTRAEVRKLRSAGRRSRGRGNVEAAEEVEERIKEVLRESRTPKRRR